ncbi:unnamed protein product [Rotaria socialis]|uniref:Uncharacterized protein n=1 Tax=Rotaria socialis TaxID=392032 RepID=A0A817WP22_9BILA|nr:unnamed protein product [Rotaria socialis]CAF3417103.1 unnamed protein product [Rotaria socialis]CAF4394642.1 unnamed protein product [Rotaria socialis]CAF4502721.1 unnamed protein product [Rotaria socialis]
MRDVFNPRDFESPIGLEGRKRQVAELGIMNLYALAFAYSTFVESSMTHEYEPNFEERTVDINSYRVSGEFRIIDFPPLISTNDLLISAHRSNCILINAIIVVLDATAEADSDAERTVINIVKLLSEKGVDVLYCFNKADKLILSHTDIVCSQLLSDDDGDQLIRYLSQDITQTDRLNCSVRARQISKKGIDNRIVKQKYVTTWTKENVSETLVAFAKNYDIPLVKCMLTFCELDEPGDQRHRIFRELLDLGLQIPTYIKGTWLKEFLESNSVSPESIHQILEFSFPQ